MNNIYFLTFVSVCVLAIIAAFVWVKRFSPQAQARLKHKRTVSLYETQKAEQHQLQEIRWHMFLKKITKLHEESKEANRSLVFFTNEILDLAVEEMDYYLSNVTRQQLLNKYVPAYFFLVMGAVAERIMSYSDNKNYQSVGLHVLEVMKNYFNLLMIDNVLYRHRSHIRYSDRLEGLTRCILTFFVQFAAPSVKWHEPPTMPMDYSNRNLMMEWDEFDRAFNINVVDGSFANAMAAVEKNDYATQARLQNQEHQRNKRQRSKRLVSQKKRSKRYAA